MKVMIMMPAIYRLNMEKSTAHSVAEHWGWHRATELFEAINNILVSQGKKVMTALEIAEQYKHIAPWENRGRYEGRPYPKGYITVDQNGNGMLTVTGGYSWFESAVNDDRYLPAKVGMRLIEAVKHPIRSKVVALLCDQK